MLDTIRQRISFARKRCNFSQAKLASLIDVSRSAVGQWEAGLSTPSTENLSRIAVVLNVRFEWLALNRGAMEYENTNDEPMKTDLNKKDSFIPTDLKDLIEIYHALPSDSRSAMIAGIKALYMVAPKEDIKLSDSL